MLEFRQANGHREMEKIHRLRYEVYCLEKRFLEAKDYPTGEEVDEYDLHSVHFLALEMDDGGKILGTLRLIKPSKDGFPAEHHFQLTRPIRHPEKTLELSRLIIAKESRHLSAHILMGLSREVYWYSKEHGVEDLYAILEDPLLRLLRRLGLPFVEVGERRWYLGAYTFPTHLLIPDAERTLAKNNAFFYAYLKARREEQVAYV